MGKYRDKIGFLDLALFYFGPKSPSMSTVMQDK